MQKVKKVNFKPIKGRILVKEEQAEEVTKSGLIIPDSVKKEKPAIGVVVAVSEPYKNEHGISMVPKLKVCDEIAFGEFSGVDIKIDEEDYLIMREQDVFGVLNNT